MLRRLITTPSLWRARRLHEAVGGQTVSELGSVVTRTAVPLVALLVLGAGPFEMALPRGLGQPRGAPGGLFAGAWVDRLRRRPLLIGADVIRAVLLFSIPRAHTWPVPCEWSSSTSSSSSKAASAPCSTRLIRHTCRRSSESNASSRATASSPRARPWRRSEVRASAGAPRADHRRAVRDPGRRRSFVVSAISLVADPQAGAVAPARTTARGYGTRSSKVCAASSATRSLVPMTLRSVVAHVAGSFYGVLYTIYLIQELHLEPIPARRGRPPAVSAHSSVRSSRSASSSARFRARQSSGWPRAHQRSASSRRSRGGPLFLATLMVFLRNSSATACRRSKASPSGRSSRGVIPDRILGRVNATLEVFSHGIAYPIGAR